MDPAGNTVIDRLHDVTAAPDALPTPPRFAEAVAAARLLSREVDFARFDFLADVSGLWAGEITLFPAAGHGVLEGDLRALVLGTWDLRDSWFLREGAARRGPLARAYAAALRRACDAGALDA
jgi:hypothetical protein